MRDKGCLTCSSKNFEVLEIVNDLKGHQSGKCSATTVTNSGIHHTDRSVNFLVLYQLFL